MERFNEQLQATNNEYAKKIEKQIEEAVEAIVDGGSLYERNGRLVPREPPSLEITLDDDRLYENPDLFIQIVGKHFAVERFQIYHQIHILIKEKGAAAENTAADLRRPDLPPAETAAPSQISPQELMFIQNQINLTRIYIDVFKLFDIRWKYDPTLSVQKIYAYYSQPSKFQMVYQYIGCLQQAHQQFLY